MRLTILPAVVASGIALGACGEVDQRICADVPKVERAVASTDIRSDFKQELLEDISERATEANCPGYDTVDD